MPFEFAWAVKDEPSYNDYSHQTKSDGKVENGSYRVVLPDGRTQIVTYKADDYTGYVAEVKYEGEAKYSSDYKPAYKPAYPKPAYPEPSYPKPAYPAPSYPAPAYPAPKPAYPKPAYP